jgi:lambda repressor-like predicted transcriptional regulator
VYLSDIWISDCFDAIYWQYKAETSFVIGWPTSNNFIADFKDTNQKEIWLSKLKE